MAEHIPGDKAKAEFREAYVNPERQEALIRINQNRANASYGFYGDSFGNGLYAPPVEFGGGGGMHNAFSSPSDSFTNPARHQLGGYSAGYQQKEGWVYGRGGFTNVDHIRIAQSLLLYKTEGIVQRIVHLLADFVVEDIDIIHPDLTVHNFYQAWKTKVGLKDRLHRFVVDLLTTGNVFIWTRQAKLKPSESRDMKRGLAAELIGNDLVVEIKDADGKRLRHKTIAVETDDDIVSTLTDLNQACRENATAGMVNEVMLGKAKGDTRNTPADPTRTVRQKPVHIPWSYISLNPLQMEPRGSRFANEHYWVMLIHKRDMQPLSKFMTYRYYTDIQVTKVNLPEIFKGKLKPISRAGTPYAAELELDRDRLAVIHDVTKSDYEDWATPQIFPACKEVQFKRMLRMGEISAMESLKHMITLIRLGDVKEGFSPTEEQLDRVASALAGGSQTHYLVWDDLIDGQVLQPNIGNIFDPKKYQQIDKDIYAALGVAESVFSGNASYANSFMSVKLLLEKLETIREKLETWLRVEIKKIADAMKFRRLPAIKWGLMNLRDENAERRLWIDLYDRGIISDQSILEQFDTDFEMELSRQKIEKDVKDSENEDIKKPDDSYRSPVMVSRGPFNRDLMTKNGGGGSGGRPSGSGKPQETQRNTKPRGMSGINKFQAHYAYAQTALKTIGEVATRLVVDAQDVKDVRSLSKAQKSDLEELILCCLVACNPNSQTKPEDLVYKLLKDPDLLTKTIGETKNANKIMNMFKAEATEASSKEERLNLMCNIFAAVNAGLLEDKNA